jgi:hypothetical protein
MFFNEMSTLYFIFFPVGDEKKNDTATVTQTTVSTTTEGAS